MFKKLFSKLKGNQENSSNDVNAFNESENKKVEQDKNSEESK